MTALDDDFSGPEEPTRPLSYQRVPFETFQRLAMSERPTRDMRKPQTERS